MQPSSIDARFTKHNLRGKLIKVLPNSVDAFRRFVTEITGVEISTQKEDVTYIVTISPSQLTHLRSFFLAAFVDICEIAAADFASINKGNSPACAALDITTVSTGILIVLSIPSCSTGTLRRYEYVLGYIPSYFVLPIDGR